MAIPYPNSGVQQVINQPPAPYSLPREASICSDRKLLNTVIILLASALLLCFLALWLVTWDKYREVN